MHPLLYRCAQTALLAISLAGCGGGSSSGPAAPGPAPAPAPAPAPVPPVVDPSPPTPADPWSAPANSVPASGTYVYLQSDSGDYIGAGRTYTYTNQTAVLSVSATGTSIAMSVRGDQGWTGAVTLPTSIAVLQPGYFKNLTRATSASQATGGLDWSGEGRGCNTLTGWVIIDQVKVENNKLTALDLRFEQHCEGGAAALHGQVHWRSGEAAADTGPNSPPPPDLWNPAGDFVRPAGNFAFLVSDPGDFIGAGRIQLYTPADSSIQVNPDRIATLAISVGGYSGTFVGMQSLSQLKPGYYGDLQRYPFNNPVKGGMDWSGNGRGCNTLTGWFVVDQVSYSLGSMTAIDLRFEQHCEGSVAALHGLIHWKK